MGTTAFAARRLLLAVSHVSRAGDKALYCAGLTQLRDARLLGPK